MKISFSKYSNVTKFIILIEFFLVTYLIYSLSKNVYNSYKIDKYIETYKQENMLIDSENKNKSEDYLYFTSNEYIDKVAKQNLGLINPGEEVIVLSPDLLLNDEILSDIENSDEVAVELESVPSQWWNLFFESGGNSSF